MKKIAILICAAALLFSGCVKEEIFTQTTYTGRVVYSDGTAVSNADIKVTNGSIVYASTKADGDGKFSIEIDANEIDDNYKIVISNGIREKTFSILWYGKKEFDFKDIVFLDISEEQYNEYQQLPTMIFGGKSYHIYRDLGRMTWSQGYEACVNFVFAGYDDWYMPNKEEMLNMPWNWDVPHCTYWTSSICGHGYHYVFGYDMWNGIDSYNWHWDYLEKEDDSETYKVIAVRHD